MLTLCLLVLVPLAQTVKEAPSLNDPAHVEDALRHAKNQYAYGNHEQAAEELRALLYPMRLSTDDQVIEARKYLALCYYLLGHTDEAKEEFGRLLFLNPDYQLDPYSIAPPVIDIFEKVRKARKIELDAIRQRKSDEKLGEPQQKGMRRTVEHTIVEQSELGTFLPFGVGQFQNGDVFWGSVFAGAQIALLAVNIGSYLQVLSYGDYGRDKRELVNGLTVAQYASAALFGITWTLGVFHARLHFVPRSFSAPVVHDEVSALSKLPFVLQFESELP